MQKKTQTFQVCFYFFFCFVVLWVFGFFHRLYSRPISLLSPKAHIQVYEGHFIAISLCLRCTLGQKGTFQEKTKFFDHQNQWLDDQKTVPRERTPSTTLSSLQEQGDMSLCQYFFSCLNHPTSRCEPQNLTFVSQLPTFRSSFHPRKMGYNL